MGQYCSSDDGGVIEQDVQTVRHSGDEEVWGGMDEGTLSKTKEMLDDMRKRKIDMADEIFVINVGGYIGDSIGFKKGCKVYLHPFLFAIDA